MVKVLTDQIDTKDRYIPKSLEEAMVFAPMQKEVIWYLARRTTSGINIKYMVVLIGTGNTDLAFHFAHQQPSLATFESTGNNSSLLKTLATMEGHFLSTARFNFWEKLIYKCIPVCWVDTSFDSSNDTKMAQALKQLRVSLWNLATTADDFLRNANLLMEAIVESPPGCVPADVSGAAFLCRGNFNGISER
ncbi:uncharacterized protein LOC104438193 isoform X4 [Eucalyptus grandis]|uniref:uncharacterized protein LOC104438193 isoform X4 n=1 Tax=Eucalyptus grandis TaxID=71139 RepID=UPI00192E8AC0|nr:uncharacterized protein LOC104438193 isoform X4 [Eucalyptus grandis]